MILLKFRAHSAGIRFTNERHDTGGMLSEGCYQRDTPRYVFNRYGFNRYEFNGNV